MNRTASRLGVVVAFAGLTIIGLPGCSSGSSAPAAGTTSTSGADADAGCAKAEFADAATAAVHAVSKDNIYRIDDVKCADGWAVTSGTNASTTPAPADATIPAALYELGCLTG